MSERKIGIVTTSRADFGIYAPIFHACVERGMNAGLVVSGDHIPSGSPQNDTKLEALCATANLPVFGAVPMPLGTGDAASIGHAMSAVIHGMTDVFQRLDLDLLLVLGDRYEMQAIVSVATAFRIPIAHIHGGEESEGAIDNVYRHAISKMSHLHFCATELSQSRLLAMGENPVRVFVSGAPSLDGIRDNETMQESELKKNLGLNDGPFFLGTFHPETVNIDRSLQDFEDMVAALDTLSVQTIFTRANADESGAELNRRLNAHAETKPWLHVFDTLGRLRYFSAMHYADMMIGNSSSGIIEAASFGLPVVNIGNRQAGRERSSNLIDVKTGVLAISQGIEQALEMKNSGELRDHQNVYARQTPASNLICDVLQTVELSAEFIIKKFNIVTG